MTRVVGLTTTDNPWDYFDEWESWDDFDKNYLGYCTEAYVARIANLNDSIPESLEEKIREEAIDEIIRVNKGIIPYKKVERFVPDFT
jgi:hypothetical protein